MLKWCCFQKNNKNQKTTQNSKKIKIKQIGSIKTCPNCLSVCYIKRKIEEKRLNSELVLRTDNELAPYNCDVCEKTVFQYKCTSCGIIRGSLIHGVFKIPPCQGCNKKSYTYYNKQNIKIKPLNGETEQSHSFRRFSFSENNTTIDSVRARRNSYSTTGINSYSTTGRNSYSTTGRTPDFRIVTTQNSPDRNYNVKVPKTPCYLSWDSAVNPNDSPDKGSAFSWNLSRNSVNIIRPKTT